MPDRYKNFSDLSKDFSHAVDYRTVEKDRNSPFLVLAIHGGAIEPVTSDIARAIARQDFNYYLFEGLKSEEESAPLHLTSSIFDEPAGVALARKARFCISVHGFVMQKGEKIVIIGGGNAELRDMVFKKLMQTGLIEQTVPNPINRFHGATGANIVNKGTESGVQIEVSRTLRELLQQDSEKMKLFAYAVRQAVFEYAQQYPTPKSKHLKGPPS